MSNPPTLWAQRSSDEEESKNILLVTIEAPELDDKYSLEFPDDGKKLVFKGKTRSYESAGHTEKAREYALEIELFDAVIPDQVKTRLTGKSLFFTVPKKELKMEYWPRLTKNKAKLQFIKTDFDRWVDEDEQDGAADADMGDMGDMGMGGMGGMGGGMPGMGGMGGMPGMGGMGGGNMDFEAMMKQMGGGAGGMPDLSSLGGGAGLGEADDSDDDDMPALDGGDEDDDSSASKGKGKGKADDADD